MTRLLAAILVTSVAGCAAEEVEPMTYGDGLGTEENPIPHDGTYYVSSKITFAVEAQITAAVAPMRAFATNPSRSLLTSADATAVERLYADLPQSLEDRLDGWINAEIDRARIGTKTLRQYASDIAAIGETSLTQFTLESSLTFAPTKATHRLTALNFTPNDVDIVVPIGGFAADVLAQSPTLSVAEAGALELGTQKFGLAFGAHVWSGIGLASTALYGSDLTTTLSTAINCTTLAKTVAAKCYSTSCVGHEAQLKSICDGAIAGIVGNMRTQITAFKLDGFRFLSGTARFVDDSHDGMADRIIDGVWDSEMDVGFGLRRNPTMFTALD